MADDEDDKLFRDAMRDVRPIAAAKRARVTNKPVPIAKFTRADQQEVLRESLLPVDDVALLETGDELSFRRDKVPPRVLLNLRRGHYAVDQELDLHGLTGAEAKVAIREFLSEAVDRRCNCVRIVHGKGRRSGPRGPVLKNLVNVCLRHMECVLAFGSAPPVDGGSGAVYVLLRR